MATDLQAAQTIRAARARANLTQTQLGARAGVTQSVISAYESGKRQPGVPTLAALVEAAGFDLTIDIRRPPRGLHNLTGPIGRRVRHHRQRILDVARDNGVTDVRVFGSVARGDDRSDSDLDLLINLPARMGLVGLGRLRTSLEDLLGTPVDLVPASDLKPEVRARVEREIVTL
jgi:predicted nucleotidyltransferase/DNA-binding XRE family transcriptional regulator